LIREVGKSGILVGNFWLEIYTNEGIYTITVPLYDPLKVGPLNNIIKMLQKNCLDE
jgi:hypothetical protein